MKKNTTYLAILFLLLILNSCGNCDELVYAGCPSDQIPENAVCLRDAETMQKNYLALKRLDYNNLTDNICVSYSNQEIRDYFCYVYKEIAESGRYEIDKLGFRLYFAAKKEDPTSSPTQTRDINIPLEKYKQGDDYFYSTILLVPTYNKNDSTDPGDYVIIYDIAPFNYGSSRRPPNQYDSRDKVCPIRGE